MRLGDLIRHKGGQISEVLDNATIVDAATSMVQGNCGSVVVRTMAGSLIGIVNEKAIVTAIASSSRHPQSIAATEVMSSPVPCANLQSSIIDGLKGMTNYRYRHLVVTDEGLAIGIVSIGDLVKVNLENLALENSVLRDLAAARIVDEERTHRK